MKRLIPVLLVLIAIFLVTSRRSVLQEGTVAPEVSAAKWFNAGSEVSLAGLKGQVVVVEFWATWCPACRESIPHLNKLHDRWKGKDVAIIALSEEPAGEVEKLIRQMNIRYVVGAGSLSSFDYGVSSIPHAFVIDGSGKIVWSGFPAGTLNTAIAEAHRTLSRS